nr:hypothetical protein [Candidatus Njordarchaeota archaeon]
MKGVRKNTHEEIVLDFVFVFSFLSFIVSTLAVFVDISFALPAIVSLTVWLIMTLASLKKKKANVRTLLREGKLFSSGRLPLNSKLRKIYVLILLVSLMLFFGMLMVAKEYYILLAFSIWLFIGYLTTEEIGEAENSKEEGKARMR